MRICPERALEDFNEALRINPESLGAMRNKAAVLSKLPDRTEEAVLVLDDALQLYPESVLARTARGTLLARLGKRDLAVKDAEECLRLDSQPAIRYRVAGIYASASRLHPADAILALGNLAAAFKSGYGAELVDSDKDLDPIKSMPEFKKLWVSAQVVRDTARQAGVR
jgi:tetratricopeptide (TPR) repeat protein